jgi:hypothetical protein
MCHVCRVDTQRGVSEYRRALEARTEVVPQDADPIQTRRGGSGRERADDTNRTSGNCRYDSSIVFYDRPHPNKERNIYVNTERNVIRLETRKDGRQ